MKSTILTSLNLETQNDIKKMFERFLDRSYKESIKAIWIAFRIVLFSMFSSDEFYWDWWIKTDRHIYRGDVPSMFQFLTLEKGKTALDIGSGHGFYAKILRDNGFDVTCSDRSKKALKILAKKGFKTKKIDISQPFGVDSYDLVSCMGVLHHVINDEVVIDALKIMRQSNFLIVGVRDIKEGKDTYKFKQRHFSFYSDVVGGDVIRTGEYLSFIIKENKV